MSWSLPFDKPIQPPKGKKLVTLKDAAAYIMALPKAKQQSSEWQAAGERLSWRRKIAGLSRTSNARSRRNDAGAARRKANSRIQSIERKALGSAKAEAGAKMLVNV